ncbi:hypothetical protein, partial [Desulfobotulus sp.]|uniref:hypothetical protein n=1 Tax=Desulfobotulus sp. TaxID=1940337 RepID=UPI002A358959
PQFPLTGENAVPVRDETEHISAAVVQRPILESPPYIAARKNEDRDFPLNSPAFLTGAALRTHIFLRLPAIETAPAFQGECKASASRYYSPEAFFLESDSA